MKVIIVYASAGAGHFRAAEAVSNYLKEHSAGIELKLVDILEKTNTLFRLGYAGGYAFLVNYAVCLWKWLFWFTSFPLLRLSTRTIVSLINRMNTKKFVQFLIQDNPDFIISTHFLPSEIAAVVKRTKKIKSRLVTIITDFAVHPFWVSDLTDIYIVASEFSKEQLVRQGVKESRIKEFGIPVHSKFLRQYERDKLCKKFNLAENKFTVLIMTGSFGVGPLEDIIRQLYTDVQILVVCAANKQLYARLKDINFPNVWVFGFVDNAQELMAVSDIMITKPGGLSISEALVMELVPVFISVLPGQEEGNVRALKEYGVGLVPGGIEDIKNTILDFRDHPDKLMRIKDNIKKIKKPFAAREICNALCPSSAGDTC